MKIIGEDKACNPNPDVWSDPNQNVVGTVILWLFHPGSKYEIRTVKGAPGAPHGNQCTYDRSGDLITTIPAAGTADLYGPNNGREGFENHQTHDVATYRLAARLDREDDYYTYRPIWSE